MLSLRVAVRGRGVDGGPAVLGRRADEGLRRAEGREPVVQTHSGRHGAVGREVEQMRSLPGERFGRRLGEVVVTFQVLARTAHRDRAAGDVGEQRAAAADHVERARAALVDVVEVRGADDAALMPQQRIDEVG
nr:hypothetical protein [Microbacterium sp. Se5.02b]